jgi:hypothetical protein
MSIIIKKDFIYRSLKVLDPNEITVLSRNISFKDRLFKNKRPKAFDDKNEN